jgi:hypothetical protein
MNMIQRESESKVINEFQRVPHLKQMQNFEGLESFRSFHALGGFFLCWMILLLGECFSLSLSLQEILATLFLYMKTSCHGFSLIYSEAFSSYG